MRRNQIVVFAAVGLVIAVIGGVLYFSGGGEVRSGGNGRDAHTKVPAVIPTTNSVEPTKENEVSVASGKSESRMPFVNDRERVDSIAGGGAGTSSNERNQDTVPAQKPQPEGGRGIDSSTAGGGQAPSVRPPANSPGGESAGIGVPSGAAETSNGSAAKSPDAMIANVVEGFDRPTIEQARECVAKLERLQTEYPDSDTIRLVKDSIMRVFRAEAAFVAAKKALPAARKLANEKLNSAGICARPSPLTGRVDMEGYERFTAEASQILADAQAKLNRTQTELDNAIKAAETSTGHRFGARIERIWADVNSRNPRTPQVRE